MKIELRLSLKYQSGTIFITSLLKIYLSAWVTVRDVGKNVFNRMRIMLSSKGVSIQLA